MLLNRNRHPFDKISYYQGNCECDFVMQREENIMQLIQVTWSMADDETREREIKGLLEASSITGCNNFCTTVVSVLTHLGDHDTWLTTFSLSELLTHLLCFLEVRIVFSF